MSEWQPIETMPKEGRVLIYAQWDGEITGLDEKYDVYLAEGEYIIGGDYYEVRHRNALLWKPIELPITENAHDGSI